MLTYYQKKLIFFFFFLYLKFRGAKGGEDPLAEAQGGQLGGQEEPLTVQAKAEPLLTRSKLIIDQDLVSPFLWTGYTDTRNEEKVTIYNYLRNMWNSCDFVPLGY